MLWKNYNSGLATQIQNGNNGSAFYNQKTDESFKSAIDTLRGVSGYNISEQTTFNNYIDALKDLDKKNSKIENSINNIYSDASSRLNASNYTLNNVLDSLGGLSTQTGDVVDAINTLNAKHLPVYDNLNTINDNLSGIATRIETEIPQYSNQLRNMGSSIYNTGGSLVDMGGMFNNQASNLMSMDSSGGGLIAEYISSLQSIDPNQYVSQAATDVQNAYQNAQAQQNRALGRSGVDAGSARSVALNQQYAQAMAAASAGAKFRARQAGNQERLAAIQGAINTAGNLAQTGESITGAGIAAQGQGAGIIDNAGKMELAGANTQLGVQNSQLGVQDAWLKTVASELNNKNTQLNAFNLQAAIQNKIADTENVKNQNILANAKLGLESNNAIINADKAKLSGLLGAAEIEARANMTLSTSNNNAIVALANAQMQQANYYGNLTSDFSKMASEGNLIKTMLDW